ncbi:molybdopterin converting factor subunit 1 [Catalinimonas alkaloidigena]|uniref:molybdopterin converting factor subunit 1 n=1 Tax=Catalinimonas alkaloidigena TaxID=1075417 RepID=UPI0024062928|nr:molybdopterin converting factor subunit 1 [Catalinimonas alkaloidigena]MDF9798239.1 molybdopterin converting factor subunit 1 [Catalinimonas alkaloidigena]
MQLNILLFGVTKEIVGEQRLKLELPQEASVSILLQSLKQNYPALENLESMLVAVNNEYSEQDQRLQESDEIAIIPPVSGG